MILIHPAEEEITAEVVNNFIEIHQAELARYMQLKNLFESQAPILSLDKKELYKPDNRLVVNHAKYTVETFNGYFAGIPVKISHEDKKVGEKVEQFLKLNDMDDNFAELSKITSIYGHGFELIYQNELSETCCTYNNPLDMFIVYDDTIAQKPLFAVRYQFDSEGKINGQLFTINQEIAFVQVEKDLSFSEQKPHYYGDVPVIEYIENEERQALFEPIESLINAYDKALSEKANDVDYFADAYLSILGAELDEESVMRIRDNRIINIFGTDDASKIVVEFLQKPDGDTTQEHLLDRLERLIYQIAMVSNINDESFGNASGVALEFKLQPMKNLAAMKERKFTSGMNRRFKMVFNLPTNIEAGKKDEWRNLNYRFTRNIPRNIADEAETACSLQGVVSKKTQLSVLSIVDNVDDEIEKMAEENNASTSGYATDSSGGFIVAEGS